MQSSQRILWSDYAKAFSIVTVMIFHANPSPAFKSFIYLFNLPIFFFLAGAFANFTFSTCAFFNKKTLRLFLPYLIFGLGSWVLWLLFGRKYGCDANEIVEWWAPILGMAKGNVETIIQNPPLWFLCCLITLEWIYYLLQQVSITWLRVIIGILIGGLGYWLNSIGCRGFWSITSAMIMLPVYMLGVFSTSIVKNGTFSQLSVAKLSLLLFVGLFGIIYGYFFNPQINISKATTGNVFIFYITTLAVIIFLIAAGLLLEKLPHTIRLLQYIGKNTLLILCLHIPMYGGLKGIALLIHLPLTIFDTNIGSTSLWVLSLIGLLPIIYVINRFFPFLAGKIKRSPNP